MSSLTEYVFHFDQGGNAFRIPLAKWNRIREGEELANEYTNKKVYIAYAYILLEKRKPDYCPRIDGVIYYFDQEGCVIDNGPYYIDIFQDNEEDSGGVISLKHRKKKKEAKEKYCWKLKPDQIQKVVDCIWS